MNYLKVKARSCGGKRKYIENGRTFTDLSTHVPGYENTLAVVQIEHGEARMGWSIGHQLLDSRPPFLMNTIKADIANGSKE